MNQTPCLKLRWTLLIFILLAKCLEIESSSSKSSAGKEKELYLYHGVEGAEAVSEYQDRDNAHPDFLIKPTGMGPRLVEFYAPWCPHCQHFKSHYMQLAKQLLSLAKDQNVEDVQVHAISCVAHKKLCKNFGITGYPRVYVFPAGSPNATATLQYWKMHPLQILNIMAGEAAGEIHFAAEAEPKQPEYKGLRQRLFGTNTKKAVTDGLKPRTKEDVFDDAYKSLDFVIHNGIYMTNEPMNNSTKAAFKAWVELLVDTMPPTWSQIQKPLKALKQNMENVTKSEDKLIEVWSQHAHKPRKRWSDSCSHGESGAGYTCGLWQLFHIMTVGATEWNLMLINPKEDYNQLDHDHVALTIRNFVEHFFGCEVCRIHFLSAFDDCELGRCDRIKKEGNDRHDFLQLSVWLFETHNAVNKRLLHEKAERDHTTVTEKNELEVRYPSQRACSTCWKSDGSYDEENVYRFLRLDYWPEDSVSPLLRQELLAGAGNGVMNADDDDIVGLPPMLMQLVPLVVVIGLAGAWYSKRQTMHKTGRHKRIS